MLRVAQIIVMERGRVSIQGTLSRIQAERPDLHQAWQQALTGIQEEASPGLAAGGSESGLPVRLRVTVPCCNT